MTIFRTMFCGVFCALVSSPAWSAACGPYLARDIVTYKSGDVSKYLKYDCVSDNAKWQISGTPIEWAVGGFENIHDNYAAVKAFLDAKPDLANSVDWNHNHVTMLAIAVRGCCNDKEALNKPKIVEELLKHGAEVNKVLDNRKLDNGSWSSVIGMDNTKRKVTALDVVRAYMGTADSCKSYGSKHCKTIEATLLNYGAKTYAELNGETTSSIQAVVHQDTPEVINTTASVPPATKSKTVEISGTILDSETDEPVPYANIVLVNPDGSMISNAGCQTDSAGKFSGKFNNVPANAMMRVSFVGYQTLTLSPSSNAQINLKPTATALQEVSVVATICDDEILKKLNARKGEKAVDANGKTFCKPTECVNDLYELRDGVCVDKYTEEELEDCTLAELEKLHASSGEKPIGGECVAMMCATGYHFQEPEKVVCVPDVEKKNSNVSGNANSKCIVGRVADPKDVPIAGVVITLKDKENIKTQTDSNGKFKLCGVEPGDRSLSVVKRGYASSNDLVNYDNNLAQYIDDESKILDVRMNPWFLEKNVTISAFFSDIPDCKVGDGVINIRTRKDPINDTSGCQQHTEAFGELKTDENGNFTLDCYYPGIEFWYGRVMPLEVGDLKSHMYMWVEQHPSSFSEKQRRGTSGTNYSIGNTTNKEFMADYRIDTGGNFADGFSAKELKRVLDERVESGAITQAQADEYWKKALKNCPDVQVGENDSQKNIADAEKAYDAAHEKETSLANRMLGGLTMAATGIGGMQLAQGLAEQNADKKAEQDMAAYLATFQCKVGDNGGKSYSGGEMGIEVAGTNQLTGLYQQYVDLAASLKERKTALGMAPGIESAVVMDKANMGLYDAEGGKGIENGTYASLYRASRGNETDANKLTDQQNTSATRVKGGAIAAGVGAIGGAIGNSAINGKIADLIKDAKTKNANNKDNKAAIEEFKKGLTSAGFKNVNKLDFSSLDISGLKGKLSGVDWSGLTNKFAGQDVTQVLNTTNASSFSSSLTGLLGQ